MDCDRPGERISGFAFVEFGSDKLPPRTASL